MTNQELLNIISMGETSKVQFKREMPRGDSILKEIVAMSNSLGGIIIFGNVTVRKTFFDRLIAFFAGIIDAIIGGTLGEFLGGIC